MSKLTNCVKKGTLWSVIVVIVIAVGLVLGALCGFNTNETLKNSKTLTVTVNRFAYTMQLDEVEAVCEDAIGDLKVLYELKSEMSGDDCEIVYVFNENVDLTDVEKDLKNAFAEKTADGGALNGAFISVSAASEDVSKILAKAYVLRAVIAAVVIAVLAFAYVALRHSLGMGIVAAASALVGAGLTSAILLITRIPVTSAVAYVIAVGAMMSLVVTVLTLNKVHANIKAEEPIEETVVASTPVCTIASLAILVSAAMLLVGVISWIGAGAFTVATWFAIASILAMAIAAFVGIIYTPALYCVVKGCVDKNLGSNVSDYVGAKKTSTKVKKVFEKKQAVKEETKTEVAEETPCCNCNKDCEKAEVTEAEEEVVEETTEEVAEEVVEEAVEEAVEEVAEEAVEEASESEENND